MLIAAALLSGRAAVAGVPLLRLEAGLGRVSTSVSRETLHDPTLVLGAALATPGRDARFVVEGSYQHGPARNPAGDEHYRSVLLLPSLELGPQTGYLRVGLGLAHHRYGGSQAVTSGDTGPAGSVTVGGGRGRWRAELFARKTFSGDFELGSTVVGAQVVLRGR